MIRLIVFGAVAFVLGAGGSTGVLVMTAPAVPAGADSAAVARHDAGGDAHGEAAPSHPDPAPADSSGAGEPAPPAGHAGAGGHAESPVAHAAADAPGTVVVHRPPVVPGLPARRPVAEPSADGFKSVGNILMNMKPAESAKILAYLSDSQVEGLLRSMSPRNAASVLSQMPSERAAELSKRLLVPAPEGASR